MSGISRTNSKLSAAIRTSLRREESVSVTIILLQICVRFIGSGNLDIPSSLMRRARFSDPAVLATAAEGMGFWRRFLRERQLRQDAMGYSSKLIMIQAKLCQTARIRSRLRSFRVYWIS